MPATARRLLLSVLLAAGLPGVAGADMPAGTLEFSFSGDDAIFDFGNFSECDSVFEAGVAIDLCVTLDMVPVAKGSYEGSLELDFEANASGIAITGVLSGPAKGKARGKDGGADDKAAFGAKMSGLVSAQGTSFETKVGLKCKGILDDSGFLSALCKGKVSLAGLGSAGFAGIFEDTVAGGAWTLTIDVDPIDEKSFGGTAVDSVGPYSYEVKGKYKEKSDLSKIKLKGLRDTDSKGAKVVLKDVVSTGADDAAGEAKYKVQGYKGRAEVSSP